MRSRQAHPVGFCPAGSRASFGHPVGGHALKRPIFAAVILLAACASPPKTDDAGATSSNEHLFTAAGEACPAGTKRPSMPVSQSGVTSGGCRTKADWQQMKEITRAYERCLSRITGAGNGPAQEAACKYRMQQ